jgi:hypothetical protein
LLELVGLDYRRSVEDLLLGSGVDDSRVITAPGAVARNEDPEELE